MAPLAEMFADAGGMVQLSREQARGRAGDFEIIEYILRAQPGGVPGTWGHHFDDYLELFTRALIRTALSRLCRPGGTFYFSNIATPNPYAALMTHIGRWNLVERTPPTSRPTFEPPRRREPSPDWTSLPMPLAWRCSRRCGARTSRGDPGSRLGVRRRRSLDRQSRPSMMRKSRSKPSGSSASAF